MRTSRQYPRNPGVRLALALVASGVLHGVLLFPLAVLLEGKKPLLPEPLQVTLVMPEPPPPPEAAEVAESTLPTEPEAPSSPVPASPASPAPPVPPQPPQVQPAVPSPPPPPQTLRGRALQSALAKMAQEEFYPREAIARGLEGRVVLLLSLDENGRIWAIEVASSSGHAVLDEAARQAALRHVRLPGGRRQVLLPVDFRLE